MNSDFFLNDKNLLTYLFLERRNFEISINKLDKLTLKNTENTKTHFKCIQFKYFVVV